jgi:succinoglycan biosynthesis protein ExoA
MLNPKASGSAPIRRSSNGDKGSSAEVEPRSFAPAIIHQVQAHWPLTWGALALDDFLCVAEPAAANEIGPAVDVRPDPTKRALIVIPTLNEARAVAGVIERILDDERLVDPLVVVADGGSTDNTREIVRDIAARDGRVRLIANPGRLQSAALNLAASAIAGDRAWLVRVDAHATYPRNYASSLLEEAMRTGATSVVVSMDTVGETVFQRAVAAAANSRLGAGGAPHRAPTKGQWVDHGHHALYELAAFEAAGGYDETFSHNEDAELDLRLAKTGGRIWLTDTVRIGYHPRRTGGALWKQYFGYGKGRARTVLKHYTPLKIRQALPLAVAPAVLGLALAPVAWAFALPALLWATTALGFGLVLAARRRDAAVALAGPAAMIMHLAWSAGFWAQLLGHRGERAVWEVLAAPRQAVS